MDEISKLYIEPASCCNLHCSMCFRHNWIDEAAGVMSRQVFDNIAQSLADNRQIKYAMFGGMGEPLLHTEIGRMVACCASQGIYTELLTNATLLDAKMAELLVQAGLNRLWISIDGFGRAAYEAIHKGSQFDRITNNIAYFNHIRGGCSLGLTFVIMKANLPALEQINAFADRFSFDLLNLSHVIPSAPLKKEAAVYHLPYRIGKQQRFDPAEIQEKQYNHCPFIAENACFIKWNGDITPCMQLLHSSYTYLYEEKRRVLRKSFGNITTERLSTIWHSEDYAQFRQRVREFQYPDCTLCDGCDDRLSNETDCMFHSHPTCGACLWAQGLGRCP